MNNCRICFMQDISSCQQGKNLVSAMSSGTYTLKIGSTSVNAWCEMEGSNAWMLILKMDGTKTTFIFESSYWSNTAAYNEGDVVNGLARNEYKSSLYWLASFSQVRVGFYGSRTGSGINWGTFSYSASSLYACIADGAYRSASFDRNTWKSLVGSGSLQYNCNKSGFNVRCENLSYSQNVRLGILTNNEGECVSPDSRLGFGGSGTNCGTDNNNSVGNECTCTCDNGEPFSYKAFGYIMVR
jgi:hypothetical protein